MCRFYCSGSDMLAVSTWQGQNCLENDSKKKIFTVSGVFELVATL